VEGVYTLAGDKPMTDTLIFIGTKNDISFDGLKAESLKKIEYVEDHTLENWHAWKLYSKNLKSDRFQFVERPSPYDPLHVMYILINLESSQAALTKYRDIFSSETEMDYSVEQIMSELSDSKSAFWNRVFSNPYLSGLVHGYGEENSRHFLKI
jgi:hypothetical protein